MGADQNHDWTATIASALDWWRDAGVDCTIDDAPRDWLARAASVPLAEKLPARVAEPAPEIALPTTLDAFAAWRIGSAAPEASWPGTALPAQGDAASGLMIVTDMPDRDDEAAGQLLAGSAGALFDRMLAAIGRDRGTTYLTALAVKRPPAGRVAPEASEKLDALLRHHIALARPERLLLLGNAASRAVTGLDVANARGSLRAINYEGGTVEAVASFHPRFLLERPAAKADAWKDLRIVIGGLK